MKYCKKCGRENETDKKFCVGCGTPFSDVLEPKVESKKKNKWKRILISVLLLFVLIGVVVAVCYFSSRQRLRREIVNENWSNVEELYHSMQAEGAGSEAIAIMQKMAESYKNDYIAKMISYDETVNKLNEINKVMENDQKINTVLEDIEKLYNSRTAFELAQDYWGEADYENAIIQYQFVIENDENFTDAVERIAEGKVFYKEQVLSEIEEKASNEQYEEINDLIKKAEGILGEDEDLSVLRIKYELAGVEKQLQEFEENEEYANAIQYLSDYDELVSNNKNLQSKIEGYKTDYREELFEEAKISYDDSGYESAIGILQNGLTTLPDDTLIMEKIEEYKKCEPVGLETLLVLSTEDSSSLHNKYVNETIVDLYGNEYSGGFRLRSNKGKKRFVEFLTDGHYTNFKGSYFVSKDTDEDSPIEFRIYADGVKVYQSERINRKNRVIDFDVEINSAESIMIEGYSTEDFWEVQPTVWLTNAYVYNKISE